MHYSYANLPSMSMYIIAIPNYFFGFLWSVRGFKKKVEILCESFRIHGVDFFKNLVRSDRTIYIYWTSAFQKTSCSKNQPLITHKIIGKVTVNNKTSNLPEQRSRTSNSIQDTSMISKSM